MGENVHVDRKACVAGSLEGVIYAAAGGSA